MVTGAQVRAALREQRSRLGEAAEQVADAIRTAEHAAAEARADALGEARRAGLPEDRAVALAAASALPFERTAAGLRSQADVLEQAARQLADVTGAAAREIADGRALVRASLHSMDTALREQLTLLVELERAERARLIDRARQRQPPREA